MDGGSGGAPAPRTPPVYSAFGLVVGDLVAGGLPLGGPPEKRFILVKKKRVNITCRVNFRVNFENGGKENSEKDFF